MRRKRALPYLFIISLYLCSCVTNNSFVDNTPKNVSIKVLAGSVTLEIDGYISSDQKFVAALPTKGENGPWTDQATWTINEGTRTIAKKITIDQGESFEYTLQSAESITFKFTAQSDEAIIEFDNGSARKKYTISKTDLINLVLGSSN